MDGNQIRPIAVKEVGTAKHGASLKILGEVRDPIHLRIPGHTTTFSFRPIIVDGLAMDVNLAGPWLQAHGWDHLYSQDCLLIQGHKVPLQKLPATKPNSIPQEPLACYVSTKASIPPNSAAILKLRAPAILERGLHAGRAILEGCTHFMTQTDLHPTTGALVSCNATGDFLGVALNTLDYTVNIPAGQTYGSISLIGSTDGEEPAISILGDTSPYRQSQAQSIIDNAKRRRMSDDPALTDKPTSEDLNTKTAWLISQFKLDESPFLTKPSDLDEAIRLLLDFWDLFSHDGSFGKTDLVTHSIITEAVPPIKCKYRPINPALEPDLRNQLDKWLKHDVIEPANSPWSFNLVAAKKKNGKIRWCVDWRRLNLITKKDSFPMPSVQDNLARLAGSRIFSGVDMEGAFHCVEVDKQDREKTAFSTPFGSFQQKRLGFGVTNGPATYCRLVERVLRDIPSSVAIGFLDDGVIHSRDLRTHFINLRLTLEAYQKAGLKLSPSKCSFFRSSITYLGHTLDHSGIRPTDSYIETVSHWPLPSTKTEARAFLGVTGYYRNHIPDYAGIAKPWTSVIGKTDKAGESRKLEVTPAMISSFKELKHRLVTAPVLGFPYFQGKAAGRFTLDTDFSKGQIAGILSQRQGDKEVVIAYGSKKLSKSQQNWPSTKGELYAGMYFMTRFKYYLLHGPKFMWRTDNSALKFIRSMDCPSGIIERWLTTLADFHFDVEHRAGRNHTNVDALSRHGYCPPPSTQDSPDAEFDDTSGRLIGAVSFRGPFRPGHLIQHTMDELRNIQRADEDLVLVRAWVRDKMAKKKAVDTFTIKGLSRISKIYAGLQSCLTLGTDDVLRFLAPNSPLLRPRPLVCLPKCLWDDAIKVAHITGGHMAVEKTVSRLRTSVFFPGMVAECRGFISSCLDCQRKLRKVPDQRHTLRSALSGYPFQRLHVDFVGPLNEGKRTGAKWLLTCKDPFSKWLEAIPVVDATAENTVRVLEREIFSRFGPPEAIHTDCAKTFESRLFKSVGEMLGIQVTNTTGYNPKGNGQVERAHLDLGRILRALMSDEPDSWEDVLPQALFAMRTAVNSSTGLAPFQILFGRDVSQPLDLIFGNPNPTLPDNQDHHSYIRQLRKRIDTAQSYVRTHLADAVLRQRRQYHQDKKSFLPGSRVWLFTPTALPGMARKFCSYWTGPWIVCAQPVNDVMVRLAPDPTWKLSTGSVVVSVDRVKPYVAPSPSTIPGPSIPGPSIPPTHASDILMEGDEFAEHIPLAAARNPPSLVMAPPFIPPLPPAVPVGQPAAVAPPVPVIPVIPAIPPQPIHPRRSPFRSPGLRRRADHAPSRRSTRVSVPVEHFVAGPASGRMLNPPDHPLPSPSTSSSSVQPSTSSSAPPSLSSSPSPSPSASHSFFGSFFK